MMGAERHFIGCLAPKRMPGPSLSTARLSLTTYTRKVSTKVFFCHFLAARRRCFISGVALQVQRGYANHKVGSLRKTTSSVLVNLLVSDR